MNLTRRLFGTAALGGAGLGVTLAGAAAAAQPSGSGILSSVQQSRKLRVAGLVGEEPYFSKDIATGQWSGFCIEMARDIARELDVTLEILESTWGSSVLDLQSNKIDVSFGLNPTPKRALVVDFTRPLFFNTFSIVSSKSFAARSWQDLGRPEVRIAVDIGSTHELIARRYAPQATITGFRTRDEAILAVQSGRADCFVATIFLALTALKKNPSLGQFIMPTPYVQAPVDAAIQYDGSRRFRDFLNAWIDYNRSNGQIREWIVAGLGKVGITPADVPPEVSF